MLVLLFAQIPSLISHGRTHVAHENVRHYVDNDWGTGCEDGPQSPLGCHLYGMIFTLAMKPQLNALRYAQREFVLRIWRDPDLPGCQQHMGNVFPVGAAVMRVAVQADGLGGDTTAAGMKLADASHGGTVTGADGAWSMPPSAVRSA